MLKTSSIKLISILLCVSLLIQFYPNNIFYQSLKADASNLISQTTTSTNYIENLNFDWTKSTKIISKNQYLISFSTNVANEKLDVNTDSKTSKNGHFTAFNDGYYLISLYGGSGGSGADIGGDGGYVYGKIYLETGQTISYTLGGNGNSSTDKTGGANAGGGHGSGSTSSGTGGGYSAVYLFNKGEFESKHINNGIVNYTLSDIDNNSKYIMIAGGGGGSGASNLIYNATGTPKGGAGGNLLTSTSGYVSSIGGNVAGRYFSGENGKSSGANVDNIGYGGTNTPYQVTNSALSQPNDWLATYNNNAVGGAGGSGNRSGGAGGAGYCGGSGGSMDTIWISAYNIGGGGGGSSFIADTVDTNLTQSELDLLIGNTSDTGGSIAISYLSEKTINISNTKISGKISKYFDITDISCNNSNAAVSYENGNFNISNIDLESIKNSSEEITIDIVVNTKEDFAGGNNVPLFSENFNMVFDENNSLIIEENKATDYVNVPLKFDIITHNYMSSESGKSYALSELYEDSYADIRNNLTSHWQFDFIQEIGEYRVYDSTGTTLINTETVAPMVKTNYLVKYYVTPKATEFAEIGNSIHTTEIKNTATISIVSSESDYLNDKLITITKKLTYSNQIYQLEIDVNAIINADTPERPEMPSPVNFPSVGANTYTVEEDGWYFIDARGGDGGNGGSILDTTYIGGTGGTGGYSYGCFKLNKGDILTISVGANGTKGEDKNAGAWGTTNADAGTNGGATKITLNNAEIVAGYGGSGGGGASVNSIFGFVITGASGTNGITGSNYSSGLSPDMTEDAQFNYNNLDKTPSTYSTVNIVCLDVDVLGFDEQDFIEELMTLELDGTISRYFDIVNNSSKGLSSYGYNDEIVENNTSFNFKNFVFENVSISESANDTKDVSVAFSLILDLKPKDGFLGGNDIPVLVNNGESDTGLSLSDSTDTMQITSINNTDYANVSIEDLISDNFTVYDKTITYGDEISLDELYNISEIDGINDWRADFVELVLPENETYTPIKTTVYPITISLSPKTSGEKADIINPVEAVSVTKDATVYVQFSITPVLTNMTLNGELFVLSGEDYNAILTADSGYELPKNITVTIDGNRVSALYYSYDNTTGEITIPASSITGNIVITARAETPKYTLHYEYQNYIDGEYVSLEYNEEYSAGATINKSWINNFVPNSVEGYTYIWDWGDGKELTNMPAQDWWVIGGYSPIEYTLTINYVNTPEPIDPYIETLNYGSSYSVISPEISGYLPDKITVSGTINGDIVIDVNYTPLQNKLVINYIYSDSKELISTYEEQILTGQEFNKSSPIINGYTPEIAEVTGVMTADGYIVNVFYNPNIYEVSFNANGGVSSITSQNVIFNNVYGYNTTEYTALPIPTYSGYKFEGWYLGDVKISEESVVSTAESHTLVAKWTPLTLKLTVKYVYEDGSKALDDYVSDVEYGGNYNAPVPELQGFLAVPSEVSGIMPDTNIVIFVTYSADSFDITVYYKYEDGTAAHEPIVESVRYGDNYSISSPFIIGYEPSISIIEGVMPNEDISKTVIYYELIVINVMIEWGDLNYEYERSDWNPLSHQYDTNDFSAMNEDSDKITITNRSNIPIRCDLEYSPIDEYNEVFAKFENSLSGQEISYVDFEKGDTVAQSFDLILSLFGKMPLTANRGQNYNTGTVTITVDGKEGDIP